MSTNKILGLVGAAGQGLSAASTISIIAGAIFTLDCRILAGNSYDKALPCYLTGFPMMGIGMAAKAGYNTFNPRLHPESAPLPTTPNSKPDGAKNNKPLRRDDDE